MYFGRRVHLARRSLFLNKICYIVFMKAENIAIIKNGGVGVIPTDTVYGLACSAFSATAVKRMFNVKSRSAGKPPVIILADLEDLDLFGVNLTPVERDFVNKYWPGAVTVILKIKPELSFLDQGLGLAIRLPADDDLRNILRLTGPLATTSANPQGQPPAKNIAEAKKYFGSVGGEGGVDFYEDGGELDSAPSTLIRIKDDKIEVLREGAIKIN